MDFVRRFRLNPLLRPDDLQPGIKGMKVVCQLKPRVFYFNSKTWLLRCVAECPRQIEDKISVPVYNIKGKIEILKFDKSDPDLTASDPRVSTLKRSPAIPLTKNILKLSYSETK